MPKESGVGEKGWGEAEAGVVFTAEIGPKPRTGLRRRIGPEELFKAIGDSIGLATTREGIVPVILSRRKPSRLVMSVGRGFRNGRPTEAEQTALNSLRELAETYLQIGVAGARASQLLAIEAMARAGELTSEFNQFRLNKNAKRQFQKDAWRTRILLPINNFLASLTSMELAPVLAGGGPDYRESPIDDALDLITDRVMKWTLPLPPNKTKPPNSDMVQAGAPRGSSRHGGAVGEAKNTIFEEKNETSALVMMTWAAAGIGVAGAGLVLAAYGGQIVNAFTGKPVEGVKPSEVYFPPTPGATGTPASRPETATFQPSATPEMGLVGVETPIAINVDGGTPPPEIGQPSPWQPPSLEQALVGRGGPFPEGYGEVVAKMRNFVLEQLPGAREAGGVWNGGSVDDFHTVYWARAGNGNFLWQVGQNQAFNEYPMRWNEYQNGLVDGQEFAQVPGSKDAVLGFTGPSAHGLGEKPVLMKEPVRLADGSQGFLQYFDFVSGEWNLNPNLLAALLPSDGGNNLVWQDETGKWLAGQAGQEQALLEFDLDKKAWVATKAAAIEALELNPEREYVIEGDYLVDTYNQAKMAKRENGVWVDTTLEEKYGHLAPLEGPISPYLGWKGRVNFTGIGDDLLGPGDMAYEYYLINPVVTGNIEETTRFHPGLGREIVIPKVELVFRDQHGEMILIEAYIYSPDLEGNKGYFEAKYLLNGGGYGEVSWESYDEVMSKLIKPGNQLKIVVYYKRPRGALLPAGKIYPRTGVSSDEGNMQHYLEVEQQDELAALINALRNGEEVGDLDDLIVPASNLEVWIKP